MNGCPKKLALAGTDDVVWESQVWVMFWLVGSGLDAGLAAAAVPTVAAPMASVNKPTLIPLRGHLFNGNYASFHVWLHAATADALTVTSPHLDVTAANIEQSSPSITPGVRCSTRTSHGLTALDMQTAAEGGYRQRRSSPQSPVDADSRTGSKRGPTGPRSPDIRMGCLWRSSQKTTP